MSRSDTLTVGLYPVRGCAYVFMGQNKSECVSKEPPRMFVWRLESLMQSDSKGQRKAAAGVFNGVL